MSTENKRKQGQLMLAVIEEIHPTMGKLLRAQFEQQVLPHMKLKPSWNEPMSETEFQEKLAAIRLEIPHFLMWLRTQTFPPLPPDWTASQN